MSRRPSTLHERKLLRASRPCRPPTCPGTLAPLRLPPQVQITTSSTPGPGDDVTPPPSIIARLYLHPPPHLPSPAQLSQLPTLLPPRSSKDGEPRSPGGDSSSGSVIGWGGLRDRPACWTRRIWGVWPRESEGNGGQHAEAEGAWQVPAHQSHLHGQRWSGKSEYRACRGGTSLRRSDVPIG